MSELLYNNTYIKEHKNHSELGFEMNNNRYIANEERKILINVFFNERVNCQLLDDSIIHKVISDLYSQAHKQVALATNDVKHGFAFLPSLSGYYSIGSVNMAAITLGVPSSIDEFDFWRLIDGILRKFEWVKSNPFIQSFENAQMEQAWYQWMNETEAALNCDSGVNNVII